MPRDFSSEFSDQASSPEARTEFTYPDEREETAAPPADMLIGQGIAKAVIALRPRRDSALGLLAAVCSLFEAEGRRGDRRISKKLGVSPASLARARQRLFAMARAGAHLAEILAAPSSKSGTPAPRKNPMPARQCPQAAGKKRNNSPPQV